MNARTRGDYRRRATCFSFVRRIIYSINTIRGKTRGETYTVWFEHVHRLDIQPQKPNCPDCSQFAFDILRQHIRCCETLLRGYNTICWFHLKAYQSLTTNNRLKLYKSEKRFFSFFVIYHCISSSCYDFIFDLISLHKNK